MKKGRGCDTQGTNVTLLGSEQVTRCPRRFIYDSPNEFYRLTAMWNDYQKGFLPEAGGTDDQQAQVMQALQIYDRAVTEARADQRAANKSSAAKAARGNRRSRGAV